MTKTSPQNKISFWHPASLVCTYFGVGKIPFAPGSWGSLFALPLLFLLDGYLLYSSIIVFVAGWWCSNIYEKKSAKHDAKEIVIDEVVGVLLTAYTYSLIVSFIGSDAVAYNPDNPAILFVIFASFRVFDIVKRGPVGWVDRNVQGGLGVMLDDVVAGVLAGIATAIIFMVI